MKLFLLKYLSNTNSSWLHPLRLESRAKTFSLHNQTRHHIYSYTDSQRLLSSFAISLLVSFLLFPSYWNWCLISINRVSWLVYLHKETFFFFSFRIFSFVGWNKTQKKKKKEKKKRRGLRVCGVGIVIWPLEKEEKEDKERLKKKRGKMLRRSPTRVELGAADIQEFDTLVRKELSKKVIN